MLINITEHSTARVTLIEFGSRCVHTFAAQILRPAALLATVLFALTGTSVDAKEPKTKGIERFNFGAERPFDAAKIFGDFGSSIELPESEENLLWWERMLRGKVGRDRYLVLCALSDGNWKALGDIRDYVEFQMRKTFSADKAQAILILMSGGPNDLKSNHYPKRQQYGEGWLERNREANPSGLEAQWRIEPSVLPLLYLLLMNCPQDNRCE